MNKAHKFRFRILLIAVFLFVFIAGYLFQSFGMFIAMLISILVSNYIVEKGWI